MGLLQYSPQNLKSLLAVLSVVKCSFAVSFYSVVGTLSGTRNKRQFDFRKEVFGLVAGGQGG